jgi:putative endonuclease
MGPKREGPGLSPKQEQGRIWEDAAQAYLLRHGLVLVEANFQCKLGEIDLIMRDGATLVFVEVRQRAAGAQVGAAASIGPAKIRRVVRAAQVYLQRCRRMPPCRIDVVAFDGQHIEWLRNAIEV